MYPKTESFLMCPPTYYGVEYVINPWMQGNQGKVNRRNAQEQWQNLYQLLNARAEIKIIQPAPGLPDMPFTANAGFVVGRSFFPSQFRVPERQPEVPHHINWFTQHNFEIVRLEKNDPFEGEGDLFFDDRGFFWAGHGVRSSCETQKEIARRTGVEPVTLRLVDPRFYHLDTCFCPLAGGRALYYPPAFDAISIDKIRARIAPENRIELSEADAFDLGANAVPVGDELILHRASDELRQELQNWGISVVESELSEFILSGGSAKCLVLRLGS